MALTVAELPETGHERMGTFSTRLLAIPGWVGDNLNPVLKYGGVDGYDAAALGCPGLYNVFQSVTLKDV
jgi:hypothetical protein